MSGWSSSLFDFAPADDCMMAWCCPCILMGRTGHRINDPSMEGYSTCSNDCFMGFCLGCCWTCVKRQETREKYNIEGSGGSDFCTSVFCSCCAIQQHEREVKMRQAQQAAPVTDGYQAQKEGMQIPAANNGPSHA